MLALEELDGARTQGYQPCWAVRAEALERVGRAEEARARAIGLSEEGARERALTTVESVDRVAADNRIDTAWGALEMRVSGYAMLPEVASPRGVRRSSGDQLFSKGTCFLEAPWRSSGRWPTR